MALHCHLKPVAIEFLEVQFGVPPIDSLSSGTAMFVWSRWLAILLIAFASWINQVSLVFSQEASVQTPPAKGYFIGYLLAIMMVALGVATVCRPGRRAEKPKMVEQQLQHKLDQMSGS